MVLVAAYYGFRLAREGPRVFAFLWEHDVQLMIAFLVASVALALLSYALSFRPHTLLAAGGVSGNPLYDFFIGRPLNPRIGHFDIKSWCELRPGMMLWILFNTAYAARQYSAYGYVADSMALVWILQAIYVVDALFYEEAVLSTIDITTDGFGFMLSFGVLVWVPFVYSLQARFLATRPLHLGPVATFGIAAVAAAGYFVFRQSNAQKDRFRSDPDHPSVRNVDYIQTRSGSKLLCSGWWGRARHINYLGDWILAWSWCLPTGFSTPITYFYVVYFAVLLLHRERRDNDKCAKKYGKDWDKYCRRVPYKIIPYLY